MARNPKIHEWTIRLVRHLRRAGVRVSDVNCSISPKRYYSAYFGVPGMGEVRVSDHPVKDGTLTSNFSISRPTSYLELAATFVRKHNRHSGGSLTVIDREPYVLSAAEAEILLAEIAEKELAKAQAVADRARIDGARREWWSARIAESGIDGHPKEVKALLKKQGLRYPAIDGE